MKYFLGIALLASLFYAAHADAQALGNFDLECTQKTTRTGDTENATLYFTHKGSSAVLFGTSQDRAAGFGLESSSADANSMIFKAESTDAKIQYSFTKIKNDPDFLLINAWKIVAASTPKDAGSTSVAIGFCHQN